MKSDELDRMLDRNQRELTALEGNLLSAAQGDDVKSIYITSCRSKEGKTTSAITMATALAVMTGRRTLLVDASMVSPQIHKVFDLDLKPGLTDYLWSASEERLPVWETGYNNLAVMSRGSAAKKPLERFDATIFKEKMDQLAKHFSYVIFDGDSVLGSSGACLMAPYFDGVLLVVECEKTKWQVLNLAKQKIENVRGKVLGVILNKRRYYLPEVLYGRI